MSRLGAVVMASLMLGSVSGAAADDRPLERGWTLSAGLAAGPVTLRDEAIDEPSGGFGFGLAARFGYVGRHGVGVVADASVWTTRFGTCWADAPCVDDRADRFAVLTVSLHWQVVSRLYLQGGAGVSQTRHSADWGPEVWTSPAVAAAVGWRHSIPDAFIDFELRGHGFRNDTTLVTQLAGVVALGHAW